MKLKRLFNHAAVIIIIIFASCIHESVSVKPAAPETSDDVSPVLSVTNKEEVTEKEIRPDMASETVLAPVISEETNIMVLYAPEKAAGEDEVRALLKAYAPAINDIKYEEGGWMLRLGSKWFYWADGRLLPEDRIIHREKYRSYGFYLYPDNLLPVQTNPDKSQLEMIKRYTDARKTLPRDNGFLAALYHGGSLNQILGHISYISFLGYKIEVHDSLIPAYKAVSREILAEASVNSNVRQFVDSLESIAGFNWRKIEDSSSRSYHSFGIAVDLLPKNLGKKQIYWNWTRVFNPKWYAVPYSQRWMIPPEVIKIFEKYGFVWGGKWIAFDNMHFEYRPEILILSGKKVVKP